MPRDRKQYSRDRTKEKIAYRNTRDFFRPQKSLFHGKPVQKEPVEGSKSHSGDSNIK